MTDTTPAPGDLKARLLAMIADGDTIPKSVIKAAQDAIALEFGITGTDGYFKRILVSVFKSIAALSALPAGGGEESSRTLFGCAYQLAGYHDAPEAWLDRLSDAMQGRPLPDSDTLIAQLLPYAPDAAPQPSDAAVGAQGDGWQSMDTAPRDGTVISLRWGDDGDAIGWWMKHKAFREGSCYSWAFIDTNNGRPFVNSAVDNEYGPTHWRPCRLATPAAGKGVDDAMVERLRDIGGRMGVLCWNVATAEKISGYLFPENYRDTAKDLLCQWREANKAYSAAALTRQPVAGGGMVLVPRDEIDRAVKALRYAAHPRPSPNADALAQFIAKENSRG